MLNQAIAYASKKHLNQLDRSKRPYILHPLKVMYKCRTLDDEINCAAILHDVLEDTDATEEDLKKIGMTDEVIHILKLLTYTGRKHNDADYWDYIKIIYEHPKAKLIKMSDISHNMDIHRLINLRQKDFDRIAKYQRSYHYLNTGEYK